MRRCVRTKWRSLHILAIQLMTKVTSHGSHTVGRARRCRLVPPASATGSHRLSLTGSWTPSVRRNCGATRGARAACVAVTSTPRAEKTEEKERRVCGTTKSSGAAVARQKHGRRLRLAAEHGHHPQYAGCPATYKHSLPKLEGSTRTDQEGKPTRSKSKRMERSSSERRART